MLDQNNEAVAELLLKKTPEYRKAYSDKTAWLMACISELAYIRFEPLIKSGLHEEQIIEKVHELIEEKNVGKFAQTLNKFLYDHTENDKKLISELAVLNFKIKKRFDAEGTQALLVTDGTLLVLAFRGTESDRVADIKADLDAVQENCSTEGSIHRGFSNAFKAVEHEIVKTLSQKQYEKMPLYITGHSLGGAIASVATKRMHHKAGHAATYTFGSPRVGNEDWVSTLKTPIYRIVNSADLVPMLPPGKVPIDILGWLLGLIPSIGEQLRKLVTDNFSGYMHGGNMRFLTNCKAGHYADARILFSVHIIRRLRAVINRLSPWTSVLSDHSMIVYRKKLFEIAKRRNGIKDS